MGRRQPQIRGATEELIRAVHRLGQQVPGAGAAAGYELGGIMGAAYWTVVQSPPA